jgi:hypothetical protein
MGNGNGNPGGQSTRFRVVCTYMYVCSGEIGKRVGLALVRGYDGGTGISTTHSSSHLSP